MPEQLEHGCDMGKSICWNTCDSVLTLFQLSKDTFITVIVYHVWEQGQLFLGSQQQFELKCVLFQLVEKSFISSWLVEINVPLIGWASWLVEINVPMICWEKLLLWLIIGCSSSAVYFFCKKIERVSMTHNHVNNAWLTLSAERFLK